MNVAIAASQMQAKLPAGVKVDKITYCVAYRRVQIEILFVGKEHTASVGDNKLILILSYLTCCTLLTVKRFKIALHRSNRLSLTASLRTCAGMR